MIAIQKPIAVFFDLDNTLYEYDPAHRRALASVEEKLRATLGVSAEDFDQAFETTKAEVKKRLSGTAASHSRLLYFQGTLEIIGLKSQPLLALDLEQTYWRTFLSGAQIFDDVFEFFEDLKLAGIPSVLVTDLTTQIQFRKLIYFKLDSSFDFVVTSEEVGVEKPDRRVFDYALGKLGLETAGQIWMIGDNAINDIQGSREALGAVTFQKRHPGVIVGDGAGRPDYVVDNFGELRKILGTVLTRASPHVEVEAA